MEFLRTDQHNSSLEVKKLLIIIRKGKIKHLIFIRDYSDDQNMFVD